MAHSNKMEYPGQEITIDSAIEAIAKDRFVKTTGEYPAAGGVVLGVNRYAAGIGQEQCIVINGVVRAVAGAAVAVGDRLKVTTAGKVIPATAIAAATTFPTASTAVLSDASHPTLTTALTGGYTAEYIVGIALTSAGADNDVILVKLVG